MSIRKISFRVDVTLVQGLITGWFFLNFYVLLNKQFHLQLKAPEVYRNRDGKKKEEHNDRGNVIIFTLYLIGCTFS